MCLQLVFFVNEVSRIEQHHRDNLPKSSYTPEEVEAGFQRLAQSFGVSSTLFYLEKETKYTIDELEQLPVHKIYHRLRYLAWYNHVVSEYQKKQDRKISKPGKKR